METVPEYIARQTERFAETLAHGLETTAEDKRGWRVAVEGSAPTRSALEQVAECVVINRYIAALLRGDVSAPPAGGFPELTFADVQDAQTQLRASARELAEAIRPLDDERLNRSYQMRRGPTPGHNLILMPYRNMAYHFGQINFIQMLAGDPEFHVPASYY